MVVSTESVNALKWFPCILIVTHAKTVRQIMGLSVCKYFTALICKKTAEGGEYRSTLFHKFPYPLYQLPVSAIQLWKNQHIIPAPVLLLGKKHIAFQIHFIKGIINPMNHIIITQILVRRTRNGFGKGKAWYLGTMVPAEKLKEYLLMAVRDAGITPCPVQWPVILRRGINEAGERLHYFFNYYTGIPGNHSKVDTAR